MGTNYYFICKDTDFVHQHFAKKSEYSNYYDNKEYEVCDEPDFRCEIHLNKLSCGWRPLFQIHKEFSTFKQLEEFYKSYSSYLTIEDEYGIEYEWDEYKQEIMDHASRKPEPVKWVYDVDPVFGKPDKKYPRAVDCEPDEADLWIPFDHLEYDRTYKIACRKFGIWERWMDSGDFYSHNDPDYLVDWSKGEFS